MGLPEYSHCVAPYPGSGKNTTVRNLNRLSEMSIGKGIGSPIKSLILCIHPHQIDVEREFFTTDTVIDADVRAQELSWLSEKTMMLLPLISFEPTNIPAPHNPISMNSTPVFPQTFRSGRLLVPQRQHPHISALYSSARRSSSMAALAMQITQPGMLTAKLAK